MTQQPQNQKGLLTGFQVLEFASVLAGPSVGMFLAELGASVIKVENPRTNGDVTRGWKLASEPSSTSITAYFSAVNWGKASLAIDLRTKEGLAAVQQLAAEADIILTNFKPGDAEKLGLTYQELSHQNPALIYGSIMGYGADDPRAGYDAVIQAEAGFTYLNGQPEGPPTKMPVALMDLLAAHQLKQGLLTALLNRQMNGQGDHISVSLLQAGISALVNQATNWLVGSEVPRRIGSSHPNIAPYGDILYTADEQPVVLAIGSDRQFTELCKVLDATELQDNPLYRNNHLRVINRSSLLQALTTILKQWYAKDLIPVLQKAGIPVGQVRNMQQVMEMPQARALLMEDRGLTGLKQIAFGGTHGYQNTELTAPPGFGAHTQQILEQKLNYSAAYIDQLTKDGVAVKTTG